MPDLGLLMQQAADHAGERTVDVAEAIVRGEHLRRRRTVLRAGSVVAALAAAALLVPDFGTDTVRFLPTPPAPAVGSPAAPAPPQATTPPRAMDDDKTRREGDRGRAQPRTLNRDAVVRPGAGGQSAPALSGSRPEQRTTATTEDGSRTTTADDPRDNEVVARDPDQPREPREAPAPPDPPPADGPPEKPYCDVYSWELAPGDSDSCTYTASASGGFIARNNYGQMYHPARESAPIYWTLEITRGTQVRSYDSRSWPAGCSDDAIKPGDVVRATVYRPQMPADDPWSLDLMTGKYRSCAG